MAIKYTTGNKKPKGKKTRQGAGRNSKGHKKYRGQGGPRKRSRQTNKPR
tara:strand:+ start:875 stop:1021 length:147 start_codon:yes stop_codon:yes gene_type:complete